MSSRVSGRLAGQLSNRLTRTDTGGTGGRSAGAGDDVEPRPLPSTTTTTTVLVFGHLSWLVWVWAITAVVFLVVIVLVGRFGSLEQSLWQSAGAGWQRWVVLGAGVTTTVIYLRLFVSHGLTRAKLSTSSTLAMVVLAVIGAAFVSLGYLLEMWFFDRNDWTQDMRSGVAFDGSLLGRSFVENALALATYFVCGWLIGAVFVRLGTLAGLLLLVPCLLPAAALQLILSRDFGGVNIDVLPGLDSGRNLGLVTVLGVAVVAVAVVVARRITSGAAARPC